MTDKEQQIDVRVLDEIKEIKNLERELRGYDFSSDLDNLRGSLEGIGITQQESEEFFRGYSKFAGNYVSELVSNRLQSLYDQNRDSLENTSEGKYLESLISETGNKLVSEIARKPIQGEDAYDLKIRDLLTEINGETNGIRPILMNYFWEHNIDIHYVGQLVQMKEGDFLDIPGIGQKRVDKLKQLLEAYGLHLEMDVDYKTPEERR
ncbi:MAG: hypothetical protein IIA85_02170 [Nanoarchaeota archaeon]|nr:hypothetical protein [Nanoarchaeota archaeon]